MRRIGAGGDNAGEPTYTQNVRRLRWTILLFAALVVAAWSVLAFARGVELIVDDAKYVHTVLIPALALIAVVVVLTLRFARRLWNCRPFGGETW